MKLGVCCEPSSTEMVRAAGFDFVEWPAATVLDIGNDDWVPPKSVLPVETMNLFLRNVTVVGPNPSCEAQLRQYVETATRRAALMGTSVIVFGSAGARRIPEGFSTQKANAQMNAFLHLCAEAAEDAGVVIAIEPLHKGECNYINLVSEGAEWVRRVNRPGIGLLADTYHMQMEGEPLSVLQECAELLVHVHTADTHRNAPGTGSYDHDELLSVLREIGYRGRIAIECHWQDMSAELPVAFRKLSPLSV